MGEERIVIAVVVLMFFIKNDCEMRKWKACIDNFGKMLVKKVFIKMFFFMFLG